MFATFRKTAWAAVIALYALGTACKKDHGTPVTPITDTTGTGGTIATVNDSMYFIFKDEYLWNDVIPDSATFKPNSYSSLKDMFNALIAFKKNAAGKNMDRYGFLDDGAVAGEINEGIAGDFGMDLGYNDVNDLRVLYVYEGSPAYNQGIRRTWQITAVNGNSDITYNEANVERISNAIYYSSSVTLTLKKPDGTSVTVTLNTANYNINPVLYSSVLNVGGKHVGYLVFNQFISLDKTQTQLDAAFDKFVAGNVTDLVIDLRYNGGGSVETAEYLANLIAPASVGTSLMYKEYYNTNLTNHQYSNYLKTKKVPGASYSWGDVFDDWVSNPSFYFEKKKTLDVSNVVFIGTGSTASASELVMNVLKPYMTVKLVGDTTYGKPVGFVGITIGGKDMYAVSIWSKNAQNQGDYFDGFFPDGGTATYEDFSIDWGSTSELLLRKALITLGVPESELGRVKQSTESLRTLRENAVIPNPHFKGMIETRRRFK
ncbi:MAG TPA: S41 family peptidase [Chitinophaga sp.]|uniref:S41 family peptidase n=1 Tax=Chitinophaga sp. TaxID=1869181 RepID=UPI002DB679F3|nr:S41 family peptidase [Chitinophaga sp.]HEU4553826.1 S41 family peptidase [Chitinophaga sp.]